RDVIIERVERFVELDPIPHKPAVDALWSGHSPIIDHVVEFCDADADIFGRLDAREAAWGKREWQPTACFPDHCPPPATARGSLTCRDRLAAGVRGWRGSLV